MKNKCVALLLVLLMLLGIASNSLAYGRDLHDKQLERVLFGRENYHAAQPQDQRDAIEALQCAVYLCTDQFNGSGEKELRVLKDYNVPNLIDSLDEIDFKSNYTHRRYSHLGWDPVEHPEKGNWKRRKEIILNTVNYVFDFGFLTDVNIGGHHIREFTEQCDAFSAFIYYIHLIGDIEALDTYSQFKKEGAYILPLVRRNVGDNNPDIMTSLIDTYLPKLFINCQEDQNYTDLIKELKSEADLARKYKAENGDIDSEEEYSVYRTHALNVLDIMEKYVPTLLTKEPFFSDVFGTDR